MRLYSVFLRDHGRDAERDLILVKEGFSWPAFLFTFLWALATRMWWPAIAIFAVVMLAGTIVETLGVNETVQALVTIALSLEVGFIGNDIRRWQLDQQGFTEAGVVTGKNKDDALRRFLERADISGGGIYP